MTIPEPRRGVVSPFGVLREAWQLLKSTHSFRLVLGMSLVAALGNSVPFQVLFVPLIAGVFSAVLSLMDRGEARFAMIGDGFAIFGRLAPIIIVQALLGGALLVLYLGVYLGVLVPEILDSAQENRAPGATPLVIMGVTGLVMIAATTALYLLTMFAVPLVVDSEVDGVTALKASLRGALANIWALLGWFGLGLLGFLLGTLCCYVGAFLFMPIFFTSQAIIYRLVFPERVAEVF